MSDIIYLSPSLVSLLTPECKTLLSSLYVEIIDETVDRKSAASQLIYKARYQNWLSEPRQRIRKIDLTTGIETLLFEGTDYTLAREAGEMTLASPLSANVILRADYFFTPLNDAVLESLLQTCAGEISNLIGRPIDPLNINDAYHPAICKRLYTNVLKNLMVATREYFAVSVAGRSISKDQVPTHFDAIIKQNETQLTDELNWLRNFNLTKRFE